MKYLNFESKYDKFPSKRIVGFNAYKGYDQIVKKINELFEKKNIIAFEFYPGVDVAEIEENLIKRLNISVAINVEQFTKPIEEINQMIRYNLTDDRVFGIMSHFRIDDFYNTIQIQNLNKELEGRKKILVYGFGSSLVNHNGLVYFDMARWEIQLRYRNKMPNWLMDNADEDILRKFKRGYFIEWRTADRLKKEVLHDIDYYIDTNNKLKPVMVNKDALFAAIKKESQSPFRLVPYFDPGVWGGQWMKEVCLLDQNKDNYAWAFDGVPEENSVLFDFDGIMLEMPAINIVFFEPVNLLGNKVHARFGTEFPIRFDFLDTMEGQNLSLQVHPITEYIQDKFGMHYTQDESYYILDAKADSCVYLGLKENVDKDQFIKDLVDAQNGKMKFDAQKYVNKFPAKKHDHFLIPAGTIHCSGKDTMVLEISATPYIFTFKLYDWDRLGLDGKPRPIHIEHGKKVIQFDRNTTWVKNNLINKFEMMEDGSCKTGLHEREFIETRRYFFDDRILINTHDSVNMNNLVEGKEAIIEPLNDEFEPMVIHYAETFIIPEYIKQYYIRPVNKNEKCGVIQAYVK